MDSENSNLVLARKVGQGIYVDGPCRFIIDQVKPGRVSVRCIAPRSTHIVRDELGPPQPKQSQEGDKA